MHHLDQEDIARQFPELFKDELGTLRGVETELYVTKDATVRCFKARPVPYALREKVDGLSRLPVDEVPTEVPVPAELVLSMTTLEKSPVTAAQVATWTSRDPLLSAVVRFVQPGWPDSPGEEYAGYFRR